MLATIRDDWYPHPPFCGLLFSMGLRETSARSMDLKDLDTKVR
jgi:hypothetical protein